MSNYRESSTGHQPMEELEVFRKFEAVSDWIWSEVATWKHFEKNSIGLQLVEAADSVGANLVEGDGRFHKGEALKFFYYARGSAQEAKLWLHRAIKRGLVNTEEGSRRLEELNSATRLLNLLINYRRSRPATAVREEVRQYGLTDVQALADLIQES